MFQAACPLFVPLAEEGWTAEAETFSIADRYLKTIRKFDPHSLVLGCTHYPILREVIQLSVGENVKLIDSGEATAGFLNFGLLVANSIFWGAILAGCWLYGRRSRKS